MPSSTFAGVWKGIEELREKKGWDPATIAKRGGFTRSTWYVYQKKGNIPFDTLERIAALLDGRVEAQVVGLSAVRNATNRPPARSSQEGDMDHLDYFQDLLERYPEGELRAMAFAFMYAGAVKGLSDMPPFGDAAAVKGAPRGRKK